MGALHSNYSEIPEIEEEQNEFNLIGASNMRRQELSIADSIRLIVQRDSRTFLDNARSSPWKLDSDQNIPMISSPHLFSFGALRKMNKEAIKLQYERENVKKRRAESINLTPGENEWNQIVFTDEEFFPLETEDNQWEKKREKRLRKVASISSMSSTGGNYTNTRNQIINDLKKEFENESNPVHISMVYGLINAIIVLPVLMSFGSIIFNDTFFKPYLPILVKLTVLSGAVHQICFSSFSTLPFSVGQVQDAGLIFLSTIASNIVSYCRIQDSDDEEILATVLVGLSLFTAILGGALVLIGHLRLASIVRQLPTPVVGGYLAFIGFFCGQSGLTLMSGVHVDGIKNWNKFLQPGALMLLLPGVVGGLLIFFFVRKFKHMSVLPLSILFILVAFYSILHYNGISLTEAKELGWISQADPPPVWYHSWEYIRFDKVVWRAFPRQISIVISMIMVVALSSSLDIAAIDLELPKPLEYNYELQMVGLSNICSGLTMGYTGSYIFSQTLFTLRAGIRSRLSGYVIAFCELLLVVLPISILNYIPNLIFGSLLVMICIDLVVEWLWEVRKKVSSVEYFVALSTFVFIQVFGVEYGILGGLFTSMLLSRLSSSKTVGSDDLVPNAL